MITFIVPTIGRESLWATLASIELWPGDELMIVGEGTIIARDREWNGAYYVECPRGNDWGHAERNVGQRQASGRYLAHIDDDDTYAPGTRALMADAIEKTPDRPALFRMQFPNGITLWNEEKIFCGNVGTPMMLIPNVPEKLGTWGSFVGGDCHFLETSKWTADEYVWRPEVIALLGHNT